MMQPHEFIHLHAHAQRQQQLMREAEHARLAKLIQMPQGARWSLFRSILSRAAALFRWPAGEGSSTTVLAQGPR